MSKEKSKVNSWDWITYWSDEKANEKSEKEEVSRYSIPFWYIKDRRDDRPIS